MTVTILYCPLCALEVDRRSSSVTVASVGDESIEEAVGAELERVSQEIEAKVVSHLERHHPFRFWLHRRGILGIRHRR